MAAFLGATNQYHIRKHIHRHHFFLHPRRQQIRRYQPHLRLSLIGPLPVINLDILRIPKFRLQLRDLAPLLHLSVYLRDHLLYLLQSFLYVLVVGMRCLRLLEEIPKEELVTREPLNGFHQKGLKIAPVQHGLVLQWEEELFELLVGLLEVGV